MEKCREEKIKHIFYVQYVFYEYLPSTPVDIQIKWSETPSELTLFKAACKLSCLVR
jgi:hypothetical protein